MKTINSRIFVFLFVLLLLLLLKVVVSMLELQNPTHTFAFIGIFNVCLTATNDCGSTTLCENVDVISGVEDALEWSEVGLFPNPTRDRFTVAITCVAPASPPLDAT